jgi:hypothetical protein
MLSRVHRSKMPSSSSYHNHFKTPMLPWIYRSQMPETYNNY